MVLIFNYEDGDWLLLTHVGHFWNLDVHGHYGMFLALFASPLGRVPEQILQRRRLQICPPFLQSLHYGKERLRCFYMIRKKLMIYMFECKSMILLYSLINN